MAASTGPTGTICFRRLSSIRRIWVGWLGTRIHGPLGLPVACFYTRIGPKNQRCEEKKRGLASSISSTYLQRWSCAAVKVRRIPDFSGLATQARYLALLDDWFVAEHREEVEILKRRIDERLR